MTGIRAISLKRPWTELILGGHKPIENRTWKTPRLGPLIIHGSQGWDDNAGDIARPIIGQSIADLLSDQDDPAPTGYLGVVDLTYICTRRLEGLKCTCGPWAFNYSAHWWVSNPRRFPHPIPGPGQLGLWTPPDDITTAVNQLTQPQEANQ